MKKKLLGLAVFGCAAAAVASLASCKEGEQVPEDWKVDNTGTVLNIQCWNDEFRVFFHKYLSDEGKALLAKGEVMEKAQAQATTGFHLDSVPVVWTETENTGGKYQKQVDLALENQKNAKAEDKVDLFLAEADYILKYAGADYTQDIKTLGVTDMSQTYNYTVQAASDSNSHVKGVSFQCCPSGLIYNRKVAAALWGEENSTPEKVASKLDSWEKFDAVAEEAKKKNFYMTACEAETYRVFSNNATTPWVKDGQLEIPQVVKDWMDQSEKYVENGYTIAADVWSEEKTANITADVNNTLCCFGPAWYYNFCMGSAKAGDWGLVPGPQAHFWGGTWLLAAAGSDNTDLVAKVMNSFINDETILEYLVTNEGQFTNNQKVNEKLAKSASNAFLGGQNDTKVFTDLAKNIKFENVTVYDQLCNEGIQQYWREYLKGTVSKEKAISNFYDYIQETYPNLTIKK